MTSRSLSTTLRRRSIAVASGGATAVALLGGSLAGLPASAAVTHRAPAAAIPKPAKDPAVAKLVPAAIRAKGQVSVAMDATYPPDEFVASNGTIVGMDADLGAALGAVMGVTWKPVNATFDTIITGLKDGKFDVGNSSFTVTAAREKEVNFVSYFQAGEGYYVSAASTLEMHGLMSLCGKTVSVETGTTEQSDAQNEVKICKTHHLAPDTVLSFSDQNQANLAVSSGRAQLGFADSQVAGYIVQQSGGHFKLSGAPFGVAPYGIAFAKSSKLDVATLAAVKVLMKDGIYKKILDKWGVQAGAITDPTINPKAS